MSDSSAVEIKKELGDRLQQTALRERLSGSALLEMILRTNLTARETRLYQISSTVALVQGVLQGAVSSGILMENGDFGIGTFEHLDGEMLILEGKIYQMCADGSVRRRGDEFDIPFAQVCRFILPETYQMGSVANFTDLEATCDLRRTSNNLFYAFRIDGHFDVMHVRTVRSGPEGASLETAGSDEIKFTWKDLSGSLVGFWSPSFSSSFSVPGYHFHFISDDQIKGGHVLDCSFRTATARVQVLSEYVIALPTSGPFLQADLSVDTRAILRKVE